MQRKEDVTREWHLVDVKGEVLGRIATQIAEKLIGKDKATYTPHTDAGDFVVVINAREVVVTRDKAQKKMYYRHSGFPGGLKQRSFEEMIQKNPEEVIRLAVKNMLPKNRLQGDRMARLKIYAEADHKHTSQLEGK
ncbi:MAG: 50S ribosomal protein L13 [Candidatus Pacebacteria bacterium]|nr:50S ribosomal protein L13 [Candidatus Paceibacterota bacterium]MBT4652363.1 50S ribosomal protein L13 [Candidatus Paceibacterota bacterium]MBT6756190.1 50S ribosomal protein L13 [Candidatus Paceibacterota bacterium]MBT6921481.1 50S ribosomal protein L13 [Candidatus Paceibacterota bacterium]